MTGLTGADIAFIRFGVAGVIMGWWFSRNTPSAAAGIGWPRALLLTALAGPFFVLVSVGGYQFAPLAHGALFQPTGLVIGGVLFAAWILAEPVSRPQIIGLSVIVVGLAFVAGPGILTFGATTPIGDALFAGAGLMWALFTVLQRLWSLSPIQVTAAVSVISACLYTPIYLMSDGPARLLAADPDMLVAQIIVQGLLSGVVAVLAFTKAVQILGAGKASVFPALVPAVAILIGIPVAGEFPTAFQWVGLAIVMTGQIIALGYIGGRRWPLVRRG